MANVDIDGLAKTLAWQEFKDRTAAQKFVAMYERVDESGEFYLKAPYQEALDALESAYKLLIELYIV